MSYQNQFDTPDVSQYQQGVSDTPDVSQYQQGGFNPPDMSQFQQGGFNPPDMSQFQNQGMPDMSRSQNNQGGGDSTDPRNVEKGVKDAGEAFKDFNGALHTLKEATHHKPGEKVDKKAGVKKFFKAALGFGKALDEAEEAGEKFTGKKFDPFGQQGN
jgi:hypothetical protein